VVSRADRLLDLAQSVEVFVRDHAGEIHAQLTARAGRHLEGLHLQLLPHLSNDREVVVHETVLDIGFPIPVGNCST
jgi:hypothetical protein